MISSPTEQRTEATTSNSCFPSPQTKLPRLMQAVLAALSDLYLFRLTRTLRGNADAAWWTLTCQLTSWFTFYCATRTLTNSTETALTTIALYYFPWPGKPR